MPSHSGPHLATDADVPGILELVDRCFHQERGGMARRLPFIYDDIDPSNHAVVERDGEVVAHVALLPQALAVGGNLGDADTIDCPGVGGVATHPAERGGGHMSALLEFWLDRTDAPVLELGGDRQRYGQFGWEKAGRELRYRLTDRSLPADGAADFREYDQDGGELERVRDLHRAEPYGVCRDERTAALIHDRTNVQTILTDDAYVTFVRDASESSVVEFGGDSEDVLALCRTALDHYAHDAIQLSSHPTHAGTDAFRAASSHWHAAPLRMLNVRDLHGLLDGFATQIERRLFASQLERARVVVGMESETDGVTQTVELAFDGALTIDAAVEPPDLTFDRRALVTLLFGFPNQMDQVRREWPLLDVVCPLGFYVWRSERV